MAILTRKASDVSIREVNLSQTLSQNSNAIGCLVVVAGQGPSGPHYYTTADDFRSAYGDPKASISFDHYAAIDYFREGNGLWCNRALEADARMAAAIVLQDSFGNTVIRPVAGGIKVTEPNLPNWTTYVGLGETPMYLLYPKNGAGSFGNNLAVSLSSPNLNPPTNVAGIATPSGAGVIQAGTYAYLVSAISTGGNETLGSTPCTVIISTSTQTNTITVSWNPVVGAIGYKIYGRSTTSSSSGLLATIGAATTSWVDDGLSTPDTTQPPITTSSGLSALSTAFTLSLYDLTQSVSTAVETFDCTTDEQTDDTGAQSEVTQRLNPYSQYMGVVSYVPSLLTAPTLKSVVQKVQLAGGTSGSAPTLATINRCFAPFTNKSKFVVDVLINAGRGIPAIQMYMDGIAQRRGDCVAFLDVPPQNQEAMAAIDYRNVTLNLNSSYSALFVSDLLESDPVNGKFLWVPPSGAMAGLVARTARIAQPWFSPAGLNRGLVSALDVRYTYEDGEATQLYLAQVNYMRKFVGNGANGIAWWEGVTLASESSAFQFINVRMLLNTLKRSMYQYLLYAIQEQNDDILKLQVTSGLSEYLDAVKSGRGISSYQVVANNINNTPALANSGTLAIAVVITPILAVRAVELVIGVGKQGLNITENAIAAL